VDYADWPVPGASTTTFHLRPSSNNGIGRLGAAPPAPAKPVFETIVDDSSIDAAVLAAAGQSPNRLVYQSDPITKSVHISGTPAVSLRMSFNRPAAIVSAMLVDYKANGTRTIVTRGWADPQNRKSPVDPEQSRLLGRDGLDSETFAIDPGRPYTISFELQPHDYVFQPGSRLGLMLYSSDQLFTQYPSPGTRLTLETGKSTLSLPVVGGAGAVVVAVP
jgi:X-Pro dipeptidyl-peptidase